ncbi:peptidoglycan DD-metalloendopeptidase family protein [Alteromonas pelagimontana]|uniref:Peptidoglycan DD-metalloendopeptidase family protein n=1 Tax=Alteromonas pelagimontana TaxID=1858656 RepID=A0A6M4MB37_9ALTE|nr:M23 family metallopeptidase [Alteromonas pelagimontana]QJR80018.1 peptidoglycan DD-metalloendopeptidase family protein [Alteromonas pelagimontana]
MKLTITLVGKHRRYRRSISVRTLVSLTVLSSLFMLVSSRSTESVSENLARVKLAQQATSKEQAELDALKLQTQAQLQVLAVHLATLQAQVSQLDEQGNFIAEELGMKAADLEVFKPDISPKDPIDDPLMQQIAVMQQSLDSKTQQLNMLESLVRGHHIQLQSQLSGRPVGSGWLSSYYGMRADPFTDKPAMHQGVDFAGASGDDVVATAAGIVTWAGTRHGYGELVEIEHGNGLITRYGHNRTLNVSIGDIVTKGQVIAEMGNTGRSTGAHVHYEVIRGGQQIDPLPFVYPK